MNVSKKDFSPTVKKLKNVPMDNIENTDLFESYLKTKNFTQVFDKMLWGEGPCYIPRKDMLIWSDNPNNRMLKLFNGKVSTNELKIICRPILATISSSCVVTFN